MIPPPPSSQSDHISTGPEAQDPWATLLAQADTAQPSANIDAFARATATGESLGQAIRQRVRRQQRRHLTAVASLSLTISAGIILLLPQPHVPAPYTRTASQLAAPSTPPNTTTNSVPNNNTTDTLLRQAAFVRTLARAVADQPTAPPRPDGTALITDLTLRLTALETTTWLDTDSATARYTQLVELFPNTPAAQAARLQLDRLNTEGIKHATPLANPA